ncbi:serine hydrolase [Terriglobus albidus]|uniref:serine hydrolase n=1 Tax=Terriglobus albidus TaxID=1592106 RepID=UPI0021E00DE8|nr:serine hydrolase [Terriglobus albidus]
MKKLAVLLLLLSPVFLFPQAKDPAIPQLEQGIPQWMQAAGIPGVSIALVRHGKTEWLHSFGMADVASGRPVTQQTIFNVGSLSKVVFSYAVLRLVDQGKLDLDTPLTHYLPKPYIPNEPRLEKITARIVLSHRTGFPNWRPDKDGPLVIHFTPGERFSYSGEGMVYLQAAIEAITHKQMEDVMREEVFQYLGMKHSSYVWHEEWAPLVATGYESGGAPYPIFHAKVAGVAGSLITTPQDYAGFLEAILRGKGLKPATLREMETPQIAVDPTCFICTDQAPGRLSDKLFWGLGWAIEKNSSGTYLWHYGDNGVFKAYVSVDLKRRDAVVYFANSRDGLAMAPVITQTALGGEHTSFSWVKYDTYDSPAMRFMQYSLHHSVTDTLQTFTMSLEDGSITEGSMNAYGYRLLTAKDFDGAIAVFQRNVALHPQSSNCYDSLGEAYMDAGNNPLAIANYEKAIQLDAHADNARQMLNKLGQTSSH